MSSYILAETSQDERVGDKGPGGGRSLLSAVLLSLVSSLKLSSSAVMSSYIPAVTSQDERVGDKGLGGKKSLLSAVCAVIGE